MDWNIVALPVIYHIGVILYEIIALFLFYKNRHQLNEKVIFRERYVLLWAPSHGEKMGEKLGNVIYAQRNVDLKTSKKM